MTASERDCLRAIRHLQKRVELLESENARLTARANEERRRFQAQNVRLKALIKAQSTRRIHAEDEGRFLHGVLISNGIEVAHGE